MKFEVIDTVSVLYDHIAVHLNYYNKITKTLFLQIFGHAAFIKQKVRYRL